MPKNLYISKKSSNFAPWYCMRALCASLAAKTNYNELNNYETI